MINKQQINIGRISLYLLVTFLAFIMFFPILYLLFGSFKTAPELFTRTPKLLPNGIYLQNYVEAWFSAPFGRFLYNSLVIGAFNLIGELVIATLAAYALSHIRPWGSNYIFAVLMAGMMIPSQATIIPRYFIINDLGWINSYPGLFVPFMARPISIFLLYNFFRTVPKELEEAAILDGCGQLRYLVSILIPLSKATMAAMAILSFVNSWNRYMWPLIIAREKRMQTAPIGLRMFISQTEGSSFGVMMAGAVIVIFPAIIVFLMSQKHFIKALTRSSIKG